jgi:hypothetical protein
MEGLLDKAHNSIQQLLQVSLQTHHRTHAFHCVVTLLTIVLAAGGSRHQG